MRNTMDGMDPGICCFSFEKSFPLGLIILSYWWVVVTKFIRFDDGQDTNKLISPEEESDDEILLYQSTIPPFNL